MQINLSPELTAKYEELRQFYQQHDNDIIEVAIANLHDKVIKIAVKRTMSDREAWLAENGYVREWL
jgi:hypothetical protein